MILGEPIILGGGNGIACVLIISTDPSAIVTCRFEDTEISQTADADGKAVFELKKAGVWTITASLDGETVSKQIDTSLSLETEIDFISADRTLENNTWETISEVAKKGKAANYWAVGDTKAVLVKGTYGYFSLDINCYAFILGINHNEAYEGKGIHFSFKNSSKKDVAFYTFSMYDSNGTSTNNNWGGSLMRTYCDMFPSFFPADLRAVYSPCTKYTDNTGGFTDSASYVTATVDKTFLLSEFEIFGVRTSANSAEQNFQKQYDYYKAGNSRVRYHHINGTAYNWWTRSCSKISPVEFMVCNSNGSVSSQNATTSIGFVPCFKVG